MNKQITEKDPRLEHELLKSVLDEVSAIQLYLQQSLAVSEDKLASELVQTAIEESGHALQLLAYLGLTSSPLPVLTDSEEVTGFNSLLEAVAVENYSDLMSRFPEISDVIEGILSEETQHEDSNTN